ncbi:uncharacterized protein LOC135155125 [Lytechinus pictus]|uniref:uncharacterized protein LOC135155125 n=1 Tax=Lytechinus pictus TaxID=7653 RepID=UPI0030BA1AD4
MENRRQNIDDDNANHDDDGCNQRRRKRRYKQYLRDDNAKIPRQTMHNWLKLRQSRDDHDHDSTSSTDMTEDEQSGDADEYLEHFSEDSTCDNIDDDGLPANVGEDLGSDSDGNLGEDQESNSDEDDPLRNHDEDQGPGYNDGPPGNLGGDAGEDPGEDPDEDVELNEGNIDSDQALLMILTYVLRHKLTGEALQDLLTMLNQFVPGLAPVTKYLFSKGFCRAKDLIEVHYYCKTCMTYIGKDENLNACPNEACAVQFSASENMKNGSFILYIPIQSQLEDLFANRDIASSRLIKQRVRKDTLDDIFDGAAMQKLITEGKVGPDDFTLLWNCDGVPVFKSSNYSIWPIQIVVNELPADMRRKHVLFCGLWFGLSKPDMSALLAPLVSESEQLADGFDWIDPVSTNTVHSKVFLLTSACDSVARPALRNCKQFNGMFGCDWCLHPGEVVEKGRGTMRCYPYIDPEPPTRSQEQWEEDVTTATPDNAVNGVKGPSLLLFLPLFNIITGFVADYMHCVLLGVTRQFVRLWFDPSSHDRPWYLGNRVQEFDNKLLSIKPPRELSRAPRSINTRSYWKASEWKYFLLYYSPFVLSGLMPVPYMKHWYLLVFALHVLLQSNVSRDMIDQAELALKKFVIGVETLYGKEHITFNVHLLTHLPDTVRDWGPLWAASAFSFEANNGKLLKFFHGTQYVPQQITQSFLLWRSIPKYMRALNHAPLSVKKYVDRLWTSTSLPKHCVKIGSAILFGSVIDKQIPLRIVAAIRNLLGHDIRNLRGLFYKRILIGRCMFCCISYTRSSRRIDYGVEFEDGLFGIIKDIMVCKFDCICLPDEMCQCLKTILIVYTPLVKQNAPVFQDVQIGINSRGLIHEVRESLETRCSLLNSVKRKCVVIFNAEKMFVTPLCNTYESD